MLRKRYTDDQRKLIAEKYKLLENYQKAIESVEALKIGTHADTPRGAALKTQNWTSRNLTMRHHIARVDNARPENAAPVLSRLIFRNGK